MADQNVTINIRTRANTRGIDQTQRKLAQLTAQSKLSDRASSRLASTMSRRLDPAARKLTRRVKGLTSALAGFNKLALKVFGVTLAGGLVVLASVNALFATGRFLVQAYRVTMQALAVSVAAVGAGLATLAAAMREYNAAVYAYSYSTRRPFESSLSTSRAALRGLQTDAELAVFGMESLNAAFASLSRAGVANASSVAALRSLADFAASGGDPAKNLQAAAEFVALLRKEGRLTEEVIAAGAQVSTKMSDALDEAKKKGITSYQDFIRAVSTGQLEAAKSVQGQAALLGGTLVGQFKIFTMDIRNQFADIGQYLLGPVKGAFEEIFDIIRFGIIRIAPEMVAFGSGRLLDGLVSGIDKLTDFLIDLYRKYLPASVGMLERFSSWWAKVQYVFDRVVASMRPLLDGGRAVIDLFGPAFGALFDKLGLIIQTIDRLIVDNREEWERFANAVVQAVALIGDFVVFMIETFDRALPVISPIVEVFTDMAYAIMGAAEAMQILSGQLNGRFGSFVSLAQMVGLLFLGLGFKNFRAGRGFQVGGFGRGGRGGRANTGGGGPGGTGTLPGDNNFALPVGGAQAAALGRFSRVSNAMRGARRGGQGLMGRIRAGGRAFNRAGPLPIGGLLPSLALSGLSFMVDDEAQGGVGTGAGIAGLGAMLKGRAGIAGALLGTGVAGYSIMRNARTAGGGALGGGMAGASLGATIGMLGGPVGMVVGGLIGGAAGAIVGAIKGRAQGEKKKVEDFTAQATGELYSSVATAMVAGDTTAARAAISGFRARGSELQRIFASEFEGQFKGRFGLGTDRGAREARAMELAAQGVITADEARMFALAPGTFADGMADAGEQLERYLSGPLDRYDAMLDVLTRTTGKTTKEIEDLAKNVGLNLYDDTIALSDALDVMGLAVVRTKDEIIGAARDIAVQGLEALKETGKELKAPYVIRDVIDNFRNLVKEGTATTPEGVDFVTDLMSQLFIMFPDDPIAAVQEIQDLIGPGGALFKTGQAFEGMEPFFMNVLQPVIADMIKAQEVAQAQGLAEQIAERARTEGLDISFASIMSSLSGMSLDQLNEVLQALANPFFLTPMVAPLTPGAGGANTGYAQQALEQLGISALVREMDIAVRDAASIGEDEAALRAEFFNVVTSAFDPKPGWMDDFPVWWEGVMGDTSTPRLFTGLSTVGNSAQTPPGGDTTSQRFSQTLMQHGRINGMLPGSRTITSGIRNYNLGSINSDHLTGRAYDLTGQNLGAYASMVNRMGGFAEFHGAGGSRHLHVVPGQAATGDTLNPAPVRTGSSSGATVNNTYSIVVQGGNDSAEVIARKVMDTIKREQRSNRERS